MRNSNMNPATPPGNKMNAWGRAGAKHASTVVITAKMTISKSGAEPKAITATTRTPTHLLMKSAAPYADSAPITTIAVTAIPTTSLHRAFEDMVRQLTVQVTCPQLTRGTQSTHQHFEPPAAAGQVDRVVRLPNDNATLKLSRSGNGSKDVLNAKLQSIDLGSRFGDELFNVLQDHVCFGFEDRQ